MNKHDPVIVEMARKAQKIIDDDSKMITPSEKFYKNVELLRVLSQKYIDQNKTPEEVTC